MHSLRVLIPLIALAITAGAASATLYPVSILEITGNDDGNRLGYSVATAGDVNGDGYSDVIVGEPNGKNPAPIETGWARVYFGGPDGGDTGVDWALPGTASSEYGQSVATAGDVNGDGYDDIIVGAPGYSNGQANEGAVFVYLGGPSGPALSPNFAAEGGQANMRYGWSVATAGDVNGDGYDDVVVGAPGYTNTLSAQGRAYVYLGSASGLVALAHLRRDGDGAGDNFGASVSTAGDVNGDGYADVLVGAYLFGSGFPNDIGAAYCFHGSATGVDDHADWVKGGTEEDEFLGFSVSLAGDLNGDGYSDVLVGSYGYDTAGGFRGGRAQAFAGTSTGLSGAALWTRAWTEDDGLFGYSVATAGDVNADGYADLVVGAPQTDDGGIIELHYGTPSGPSFNIPSQLSFVDGSQFGWSVATAGDVNGDGFSDVIAGAPYFDGLGTDRGKARVFRGGPDSYGFAAFTTGSGQVGSGSGSSVAYADVNGDGFSDLVAGARAYDAGMANNGRAYCWHGGAEGLADPADWFVNGDQSGALFGAVVAGAGDINGDGYEEVIVTAPAYSGTHVRGGRGQIFDGSAAGLSLTPSWTLDFAQTGATFGASAASAGDFNGDGYGDVVFGIPERTNPQPGEGAAWVYLGTPTGLSTTLHAGWEGNQEGAANGTSVACAGDVNGDGYDDIISGAPYFSNGQAEEGVVFVFFGGSGEPSLAYSQILERDVAGAHFGACVAGAGDVNGDGYSDVIVGYPGLSNGHANEGGAAVYLGSPEGLESTSAFAYEGGEVGASAGSWVASVGDLDADGFSDVGIGAPFSGPTDAGSIVILRGGATSFQVLTTIVGLETDGHHGQAFTGAGDVRADGYPDLAVGAPQEDGTVGQISVYNGNSMAFVNGLGGPAIGLAQYRAGFSGPIALRGQTDSQDTFDLGIWLRSAYGRAVVQLEHSVVPRGTVWGPTATSPEWYDTGAPVVDEGSRVRWVGVWTDQDAGTVYHWRFRTRTDSPFFPRTPWFSLAGNAPTEADLRTQPNPAGIADELAAGAFRIESVAPQPMHGASVVRFALEAAAHVRLTIHDVSGRRVAVLADGAFEAGAHGVAWDGRSADGAPLASGVYFARLDADGAVAHERIVVAR